MVKLRQDRLFVFAAIFANICFGQAGRGELFGLIQDPSGLAIPKAKVVVEAQATLAKYSAFSDERGEYHVLGLAAGQYVVTVNSPGLRAYRLSGLTLRLSDRVSLNVKLEIGNSIPFFPDPKSSSHLPVPPVRTNRAPGAAPGPRWEVGGAFPRRRGGWEFPPGDFQKLPHPGRR